MCIYTQTFQTKVVYNMINRTVLLATGVGALSGASDSALAGSFKHLGEGQTAGEMGTLKSTGAARGGDVKTGVFSLKDSLRGEPSEGHLCLGGEPSKDCGRLHLFSSPMGKIEINRSISI